jgi:hypothetical protein
VVKVLCWNLPQEGLQVFLGVERQLNSKKYYFLGLIIGVWIIIYNPVPAIL